MRAPPPMGKTFQAWYRKIQEYHAHHTPFRLLAFPSTAIRLGFLISVPQRYSPIVTQDCKPSDLKFSLLVWGREDGVASISPQDPPADSHDLDGSERYVA